MKTFLILITMITATLTFAAAPSQQDQKCAQAAIGNYEVGNFLAPRLPRIGGPDKEIQIKLLEKKGKIISFLMNEKGDRSKNVTAIYLKRTNCKPLYKMRLPYADVMATHPAVIDDLNSRY